jgi:hypothetical protein
LQANIVCINPEDTPTSRLYGFIHVHSRSDVSAETPCLLGVAWETSEGPFNTPTPQGSLNLPLQTLAGPSALPSTQLDSKVTQNRRAGCRSSNGTC